MPHDGAPSANSSMKPKPNTPLPSSIDESVQPQLVRLVERERPVLAFILDGAAASACEGDTILTAVLAMRRHLVESATDGPRSGFCLMGACQECWVAVDHKPMRACSTLVTAGMQVTTLRHAIDG